MNEDELDFQVCHSFLGWGVFVVCGLVVGRGFLGEG